MRIVSTDESSSEIMGVDGAHGVALRVLIGREDGAPNFAMRHYTVDPAGHTPLHRHNYEHEIFVLAGTGMVQSNDTYRGIRPGQAILVPANELHQIKNTGDIPLQFICLVPKEFDCGGGVCQPTPGT